MSTASVQMIMGCPCTIPNEVVEGDKFYISYNDYDTDIYGCATTALVKGQMSEFWILNGDHREKYKELLPLGFGACMDYFNSHSDQVNEKSDTKDSLLRLKNYMRKLRAKEHTMKDKL